MNFIVPLVIYPFDIMFSIGETNKQFKRSLKENLPKDAYKCCVEDAWLFDFEGRDNGKSMILSSGQTICRLGKTPSKGTTAHEIFHCVEFILRKLQMKLCPENDEAYAYLIGYVTEQFYLGIGDR